MADSFPDPLSVPSLGIVEIDRAVELLLSAGVAEEAKELFLVGLHTRGETAAELAGFARVLLGRAVTPLFDRGGGRPLLELCGTGGDRAGYLNISTGAMFVAAGGGARVVKHGNRAFSSKCGSADVLESLGIGLNLDPDRVGEVLEEAGCVFMLAANFHPTVAAVAPLRRKLGNRGQLTVFNLLGPLLNPSLPDYQLTGIYRPEMLPLYAEAMGLLGRRRAWAVHGEGGGVGGGVDELSISGSSRIVEIESAGTVATRDFQLHPRDFGMAVVADTAPLLGGDAATNARRLISILKGEEKGAARDMILLNAAAALHVAGIGSTLRDSVSIAMESVDSGKAFRVLERLRSSSARAALTS